MKINPLDIIKEALEFGYEAESFENNKSPLKWLFHREPSDSKMKSSAIRYLTRRIIQVEADKEIAEKKYYEVKREALRVIEQFSPKEAIKFYEKTYGKT